ncbi:Adenylate cyclase [Chitinispirillum alkaliphilum]|nr:Adenylate cyclase [Chitinispirillum alkaliphilum]
MKQLFAGIMFLTCLSYGKPLIITDPQASIQAGNHVFLYIDTSKTKSFTEIVSGYFCEFFELNNSHNIDIGFKSYPVWLRLNIKNSSGEDGFWAIETGVPSLHKVSFYQIGRAQTIHKKEFDFFNSHVHNKKPFTNPALQFHLKDSEEITIYLRVESESSFMFPLQIYPWKDFLIKENRVQSFMGFYFGSLFVISTFSFLLFLRIKTKYFLYYVLFIITLALGQIISVYGGLMGFDFISLPKNFLHFPSFVSIFFGIIFSQNLLLTKNLIPRTEKILYLISKAALAAAFFTLFISFSNAAKLLAAMNIVAAAAFFITSILCCMRGSKPAFYYLLACTLSLTGFILYNLMYSLSLLSFSYWIYFLPNVGIIITALVLPVAVVERIRISDREKKEVQLRFIRNQKKSMKELKQLNVAMERFLPTKFLSLLGKKSICEVALGNQCQGNMTVLFSDIRSFSTISEQMTPQEIFEFLNRYLEGVGPIITKNNGFIDKYYGDGIMALFPDDPSDALNAGIEMQQYVMHFNSLFCDKPIYPLRIGIGIHSGNMILGTIGDKSRMDCTVISDAVNLSSRLENLTKKYHASIIISHEVVRAISSKKQKYSLRMLGPEMLRGRKERTIVYQVLNSLPPDILKRRTKNIEVFENGIKKFYSQRHKEAEKYFRECLRTDPTDFAAKLFLSEIEHSQISPEMISA